MYEVSNQFKAYCKRHIRTFKSATITYYEGNEQQTIESEEIIKFDISAEPYIDYQIIGQAVAKKIHIIIRGSYDLANKEINVTTTMIYDDNTEEVLNLGNYIIASDYDSSVKNQCSFTGYDYMIKMDDEYSDEGLTYPCTIQDVIENICEQKDIELATTDLPNGDLEVIGNNFQDGATYRDVIKQIAQVNGTFAYIDRENKLHIDTLMNHETLQGEGTSITLSGTTPYGNILDYMLKGNTTQDGTPTPSSPVPVNNVTGEQVVTICGKNRFNLQKLISFGLESHFSALDNGIISTIPERTDWSGNTPPTTASPTLNQRETIYNYGISVTPEEQLTISFDNPNRTYAEALVFYYDKDANYLSVQSLGARNNKQYVSSFSVRANTRYIMFRFDNEDYNHGAKQLNIQNIQLETGSIATTYEPYQGKDYEINLGNIELNKIGNYQDFIRKGSGKNLLDTNEMLYGTISQTDGITISGNSSVLYSPQYIEVKPNTKYTLSCKVSGIAIRLFNYKNDKNYINTSITSTSNMTASFTTSSNTYFIRLQYNQSLNIDMQLEEGSFTYYEPYGYKDKWYIHKEIEKLILDGTESWTTGTASTGAQLYETSVSGFYSTQSITMGYSNQYVANISLVNDNTFRILKGITLALHNDTIGSISNLKTFLSSNNMIVYYPLANPTYTLIDNEELIEQLNALSNGYVYGTNSNISVSGNIPSIINISVDAPGRDIKDEITPSSYLTDFKQSREYGPVNRVQITMTDIEDATYIENAESITKDGIQTITINDNYFLSSEELKAKAIRPLWNSLYTMKYMPISCKYLGLPYIEMNDYIGITLPNGDVTGTYVFNYKFTYDGGYMGELETPTISRTQETYPTESINSQVQKMGINVDRANARITSEIIARQETDENVTRIEQSIDEINLSVSTTQTDLSNLEGQVQTNTASIGVNADNISLAVEKNTQTQDQLDTLQTNTKNVVNQLVFNGDGLTISALGSTSDDMKLNLTNDAINFMYNNNVILKINGSTIEFANASFQKLDLGNYVWVAEDDDSLSLIYEGE